MNRKKAAELWLIIKAFSEGKAMQVKNNNVWEDVDDNHNCVFLPEEYEYRIKPDSKPDVNYRPFANGEECMKEMRKHEPFCSVIKKSNGREYNIQSVFIKDDILYIRGSYVGLVRAFNDYTFADGTPFGVKVEE